MLVYSKASPGVKFNSVFSAQMLFSSASSDGSVFVRCRVLAECEAVGEIGMAQRQRVAGEPVPCSRCWALFFCVLMESLLSGSISFLPVSL
jgi:hypothetical protein